MEREERVFLDAGMRARLEQCTDYFAQEQQSVYIVGGAVRNLLLHEPSTDWDFAVRGNVPLIARQLADHLHGFSAHMNDKASRVVVKEQGKEIIFDLAPLHGSGIEDDLRERDFTINAMALPLSALLNHLRTGEELAVIDPLHGREDLEARTLRAVRTDVFRHDPLRMLRAVRLLIRYQLSLEKQTKSWIQRDAPLLLQAAAERIHEEFFTILKAPGGTAHLYLLDHLELLTVLFPELTVARDMPQPELHHWDVFKHSLEAVSMLELLTDILQGQLAETTPEFARLAENTQGDLQELQSLLREAEQQGIFHFAQMRSAAMKLGALLHDIGKPATYTRDENDAIRFYGHPQTGIPIAREIMRRLGISIQDRRLVQQIVAHHMRPGQLSHDVVSERAIRRYFVDLGPVGLYVGLTSLADHLAMRGPEPLTEAWRCHLSTVRMLFTRYIREREVLLPPRLLQGDELIRRLNLTPGPLIGQLLEIIAEAQEEGQVSSKEEALWLAEEYLAQTGSRQERERK